MTWTCCKRAKSLLVFWLSSYSFLLGNLSCPILTYEHCPELLDFRRDLPDQHTTWPHRMSCA